MLCHVCVCFTVFWLCLLLLLSICYKQTCFPLRCKWPLRLYVFVGAIFCCPFYSVSSWCTDYFHLCCSSPFTVVPVASLIASPAACRVHFLLNCPILPLLSILLVYYLTLNMLPDYEEAVYLLRPPLSYNVFFNLLACMLECLLNVLQWKQMLNSHLPLVSTVWAFFLQLQAIYFPQMLS